MRLSILKILICTLILILRTEKIAVLGVLDTECSLKKACLPGPADLALTPRFIEATSTCNGTEYSVLKSGNGVFNCTYDDSKAENMIERDYPGNSIKRRWMSETKETWIADGRSDPLAVNITLSFNKTYVLTGEIRIDFYIQSYLPNKMILEKSVDNGESWIPLQFYSDNCDDKYGMNATDFPDTMTQVICTEKYAYPDGEDMVVFQMTERYNESNFWNPDVQEYLKATDVRLRLQEPYDLLVYDADYVWYSIENLIVYGRCFCSGHSDRCSLPRYGSSARDCDCVHNTQGGDCQECLPLYNNKTWQPATAEDEPNPCEKCQCYEHAEKCHYNETMGHGVCDECTHNTTGIFCDECKDMYYRDVKKALSDAKICLDCDCYEYGIIDYGTCLRQAEGDKQIGQCNCRQNVTGRRCDGCQPEFYGYKDEPVGHCKPCNCNPLGTVGSSLLCDQDYGTCNCTGTIGGRTCDMCKNGYFDYPTVNTTDHCQQCVCDWGGSNEEICSKDIGTCLCRSGVTGSMCELPITGNYFGLFDYFDYEAETFNGVTEVSFNPDGRDVFFTGQGYAKITYGQSIWFKFTSQFKFQFQISVRYANYASSNVTIQAHLKADPSGNCSFKGIDKTITSGLLDKGQSLTWLSQDSFKVCVDQELTINLTLTNCNENRTIEIDSVVLMPVFSDFRVYKESDADVQELIKECWTNHTFFDESAHRTPECRNVTFSAITEILNGTLPCDCNTTGSNNTDCDPYGGQCECKPGISGRTCDRCMPGYYNFTEQGCTACGCNVTGSASLACDAVTGICPCEVNVINRACDQCRVNYFGFNTGDGCQACNCNDNGSQALQCDADTGACDCKDSTTGDDCDQCKENFFNFTQNGCIECNCSPDGSKTLQCNLISGECECKANSMAMKCDQCVSSTYGNQETNPLGCSSCFCFNRSSECTSAEDYYVSYISTSFRNNTEHNWVLINDSVIEIPASTLDGVKLTYSGQNISFEAPSEYLGDQLDSYAQVLEINVDLSNAGEFLNQSCAVKIESESRQLVACFSLMPSLQSEVSTYRVYLHENYATPSLAAYSLQELLSNLSRLSITVSFSSTGSAVFQNISMMSTSIQTDLETANFVENCSCHQNYSGLSCEFCGEGYKREISGSGYFGGCDLCYCTGRSKDCYPETGICKNCNLGSVGDYCENCQPNVDNSTDCTKCLPTYYGLLEGTDYDGCIECGCFLNNTDNKNTSICENDSGQCYCNDGSHGRTCNLCKDNYRMDEYGNCIECVECFGSLEVEVNKLREEFKFTESHMINLAAGSSLGDDSFNRRLNKAGTETEELKNFAEANENKETTLGTELENLSTNLTNIQNELSGTINSSIDLLEAKVVSIESRINDTKTNQTEIQRVVERTYNFLNGAVKASVTRASVLRDSLVLVSQEMSKLSTLAWTHANNQTASYSMINSSTSTAEQQAVDAVAIATNAVNMHNATTLLINVLDTSANDIKIMANNLNVSVSNFSQQVDLVYNNLVAINQQVIDLNTSNTAEVDSIKEKVQLAETNTQRLIGDISDLSQHYKVVETSVEQAVKDTQELLEKVQVSHDDASGILQESKDALALAEAAVQLASQTHIDAIDTLELLNNFDNRSEVAERGANKSLVHADSANGTSFNVIEFTEKWSADVMDAKSDSDQSLEMAEQAWNKADPENQNVTDVYKQSELLRNANTASTCSARRMIDMQGTVEALNQTVRDLQVECNDYAKEVDDTLELAQECKTDAENSLQSVNRAAANVTQVVQELEDISSVNTSRLSELQQQISYLRNSFSSKNLTSVIATLRNHTVNQAVFIKEMNVKLVSLKKEVGELEVLRESLSSLQKTCK